MVNDIPVMAHNSTKNAHVVLFMVDYVNYLYVSMIIN